MLRLLAPLAVVACSAALAGGASAQAPQPPACTDDEPAAYQFQGLPDRVPFGRDEDYGLVDNPDSDRDHFGRITLTLFQSGETLFRDRNAVLGEDQYFLSIFIFGGALRVEVRYDERVGVEVRCRRTLTRTVIGYADGRRFRGWVERAGSQRPRHRFRAGAPLSFVFIDRFDYQTRYRICWQRLNGSDRQCQRYRTRAARRLSSLFRANIAPGVWQANWRVRGRIVASWRFRLG